MSQSPTTGTPSYRRSCTLYLAEERPAIIAAQHKNSAGIYYEQDDPIVLDAWRNPERLGEAIRTALERFSFRETDLRDAKRSNWPSYRASRCRSISDFQRLHLPISISAVNESHLSYRAESKPLREEEIGVCVTLNPFGNDASEKMGSLLLRLFDACGHLAPFLDEAR